MVLNAPKVSPLLQVGVSSYYWFKKWPHQLASSSWTVYSSNHLLVASDWMLLLFLVAVEKWGADHTRQFRHHPSASPAVIVRKVVGHRLFLNIIRSNSTARTERKVWCDRGMSFLSTRVMVVGEVVASNHCIVYGIQCHLSDSVTFPIMKSMCRFHKLGTDDKRNLTISANSWDWTLRCLKMTWH